MPPWGHCNPGSHATIGVFVDFVYAGPTWKGMSGLCSKTVRSSCFFFFFLHSNLEHTAWNIVQRNSSHSIGSWGLNLNCAVVVASMPVKMFPFSFYHPVFHGGMWPCRRCAVAAQAVCRLDASVGSGVYVLCCCCRQLDLAPNCV